MRTRRRACWGRGAAPTSPTPRAVVTDARPGPRSGPIELTASPSWSTSASARGEGTSSLAPPIIVGELTRCSTSIRLQGSVQHASVRIYVEGTEYHLGSADWPDQQFELPSGLVLKVGQSVQTGQTADASPPLRSALVVTVQDVRSPPPPPLVADPLVGCASFVVVDEVSPDAAVTVTASDGSILGSGTASGPSATIDLNRSLGVGEDVEVSAVACGVVATASSLGAEPIVTPGAALPSPQFLDQPLRSCQRVVRFGATRPGSTLVLVRGDGSTSDYRVTRTGLDARVDPPLGVGEKLTAHVEAARRCEVRPSAAADARADQEAPPPIPSSDSPAPTPPPCS